MLLDIAVLLLGIIFLGLIISIWGVIGINQARADRKCQAVACNGVD